MTARLSIVPVDAFSDQRLTPADVRVLGVLGSFLDRKNECFPSQARIAERANLNRGTVNKSIKKLVGFGYVRARERWPGKAKSVLIYHVLLDPQERAEAKWHGDLPDDAFEGGQDSTTPADAPDDESFGKEQQTCMLEKLTSDSCDVASGGHIDVASRRHTELPKVSGISPFFRF